MNEFDEALQTFYQEVDDLLTLMEEALLALEAAPDDAESVNSVFRAMHTIKGSAGFFEFNALVAFAHQVETVLDQIRKGERDITADLISTLLEVKDHTAKLAQHYRSERRPLSQQLNLQSDELISRLSGIKEKRQPELVGNDATEQLTRIESADREKTLADCWLISLEFKENALRNGIDPLPFIHYLKNLGTIVDILTFAPAMPDADHMNPESCYLRFNIAFNSSADKQTIAGVFEFAEDDCAIRILPPHSKQEHYLQLLEEPPENQLQRLGEMLIQIGALTEKEVAQALHRQAESRQHHQPDVKPIGEILVEDLAITRPIIDQALKKQAAIKQKAAEEATYIRVDSGKLGELIELVGELVISSSALQLMLDRYGLGDVEETAQHMNKLIGEVRDTALQLRTVHIGEIFARYRRIVRDAGKTLSKAIELQITGGQTELDKTVVEQIHDPLTHLIRNALDHGIEPPEVRVKAGKPATGTIHLNAFHDAGLIIMQISDDGAGLDASKIAAKAIAAGLIGADHKLSEPEIFDLIFAPGLSTKEQADNLSGRGVGLDVVKRAIETLRGSVSVASVLGKGTTVTIRLPLTLAIIDGFMVEAAQERYIIPLNMVEECVELDAKESHLNNVRHYLNFRGEVLPYLRLGDFFNNRAQHAADNQCRRESLVVVRSGQTKAGFVVDALHGEYQTVIKPLGKLFQQLKGISGATVLGSGNVALILDVQELIRNAHNVRQPHPQQLPAMTL